MVGIRKSLHVFVDVTDDMVTSEQLNACKTTSQAGVRVANQELLLGLSKIYATVQISEQKPVH